MVHNNLAHHNSNNAIHSQVINKVKWANQDNKSNSVRYISLPKIQELDQANPNRASLLEINKNRLDLYLSN